MKRTALSLLIAQLIVVLIGGPAFADFPGSPIGGGSGTTSASDLSSGTLPAARIADNSVAATKINDNAAALIGRFWTGTGDYLKSDGTQGTPSGTGDMAAGTWDNDTNGAIDLAKGGTNSDNAAGARTNLGLGTIATQAADNVAITGGTISGTTIAGVSDTYYDPSSSIQGQFATKAPIASPTFTGTATIPKAVIAGTLGGTIDNTVIGGTTPAAGTFTTATADEFVSTAADGTHKGNMANSAAASNLTLAGDMAYNLTTSNLVVYDNTIADNVVLAAATKTYSFGWDNAVSTDTNIFVWPDVGPNALSLVQIKCFASADNVIGVLSECASDNNASCTKVDDTDWTITAAVAGVAVTAASFENAGIAAGASLKWTTTSVGAASTNRFSCTVRYREVE